MPAGGKNFQQAYNVQAGDDMESFQWVDTKDIKKYKLNRPTQILFRKLGYLK